MKHYCEDVHEHKHRHEHDHEYGHDHAEHEAHALLDNALTLSGSWRRTCDPPIPAEEMQAWVEDGLRQIASLLAEDKVILGHIKALLSCGESGTGGIAFSITRLDTVDRTAVGTWPPVGSVLEWTLTVNVLSLVHRPEVTQEVLEKLFSS